MHESGHRRRNRRTIIRIQRRRTRSAPTWWAYYSSTRTPGGRQWLRAVTEEQRAERRRCKCATAKRRVLCVMLVLLVRMVQQDRRVVWSMRWNDVRRRSEHARHLQSKLLVKRRNGGSASGRRGRTGTTRVERRVLHFYRRIPLLICAGRRLLLLLLLMLLRITMTIRLRAILSVREARHRLLQVRWGAGTEPRQATHAFIPRPPACDSRSLRAPVFSRPPHGFRQWAAENNGRHACRTPGTVLAANGSTSAARPSSSIPGVLP